YSVLTDHLIRRIHQLDAAYQTFYSEHRIDFYSLNGLSVLPNIWRILLSQYDVLSLNRSIRRIGHLILWCMTRSSTKELISPLENPERVFHSGRKLFETPSLVESNSPEFD
ncbi:hypothetical protein Tco_0253956, partial [Tanacetum coccineum]